MIPEKVQSALNKQVNAEMWSSNLYLSMAYFMAKEGFEGAEKWLKAQAQEELEHALSFADFIMKRDGTATIAQVDAVPQTWGSYLEVFEEVLKHEYKVSAMINELVDLAKAENDKATEDFAWTFVREQVEEEENARSIVDKLRKCKDSVSALYYIDSLLGSRK